jgi:hypothetical protein
MIFANEIDASSSIKTVMAITVVDIVLTLAAVKTFNTATGVVARCVLAAERVSAQLRHRTLVNICTKKKKTQINIMTSTVNHASMKDKQTNKKKRRKLNILI